MRPASGDVVLPLPLTDVAMSHFGTLGLEDCWVGVVLGGWRKKVDFSSSCFGFFSFLSFPDLDLNSGVSWPPTVQSPSESMITMGFETLGGVAETGPGGATFASLVGVAWLNWEGVETNKDLLGSDMTVG